MYIFAFLFLTSFSTTTSASATVAASSFLFWISSSGCFLFVVLLAGSLATGVSLEAGSFGTVVALALVALIGLPTVFLISTGSCSSSSEIVADTSIVLISFSIWVDSKVKLLWVSMQVTLDTGSVVFLLSTVSSICLSVVLKNSR